jgi:hypothetical protein
MKKLVAEIYSEVADLTYGHTAEQLGYEDMHELLCSLKGKLVELESYIISTPPEESPCQQ